MIHLRSRKVILNRNLVSSNEGSTGDRSQETTEQDNTEVKNIIVYSRSCVTPMLPVSECDILKERSKEKKGRGLGMKRRKFVQNADNSECLGCKKMVRVGTTSVDSKSGRRGVRISESSKQGNKAEESTCGASGFAGLNLPKLNAVGEKKETNKFKENVVTGEEQLKEEGTVKRRGRKKDTKKQLNKEKITAESEKIEDRAIKSSAHLKQTRTLHVRIKKTVIVSESEKRIKSTRCGSQQREQDARKKETFLSDDLGNRNAECGTEERKVATTSNLTMKLRSSTKRKWTRAEHDSDEQVTNQAGTSLTASGDCNMKNSLAEAHINQSASEGSVNKRNTIGILKTKCLSSVPETYNKKEQSTLEYKERQCSKTAKCSSVSFPYAMEKRPVVTLHNCSSLEKFLKCSEYDLSSSSYKICSEFRHASENLHVQKRKDAICFDRTMESDVIMRPPVAQTAEGSTTADKPDYEGNMERQCENGNNLILCSENRQHKHLTKLKRNTGRKSIKRMVALCEITEKSLVLEVVSEMGEKHNEMELPDKVRQLHKNRKDKCSDMLKDQMASDISLGVSNSRESICASSIEHDTLTPQKIKQNEHSAFSNVEVGVDHLNGEIFEKIPELLETKEQRKKRRLDAKILEPESKEPLESFDDPVTVTMADHANDSVRNKELDKTSTKDLKCKKEKEFYIISCRRIIPMIGKNIWRSHSCARTCQWSFPKRAISLFQSTNCSPVHSQDNSHENNYKHASTIQAEDLQRQDLLTWFPEMDTHSEPRKIKLDSKMECEDGVLHKNKQVKPAVNLAGSEHSPVLSTVPHVPEHAHITKMMIFRGEENSEYDKESTFTTAADQQIVRPPDNNIKKIKTNTGDIGKSVVKDKHMIPALDKILNTAKLPDFKIPLLKKSEPRTLLNGKDLDHGEHSAVEVCRNLSAVTEVQNSRNEQSPTGLNSCSQFCNAKTCDGDAILLQDNMDQSFHENFRRTVSKSHSEQVECTPVKPDFLPPGHTSCEPECLPSIDKNMAASLFIPSQGESFQPVFSGDTCFQDSFSYKIVSGKSADFAQKKSKNFADIYEAYEDDVLVLDVIQDDPDLFGSPCDESSSQAESTNSQMASDLKDIHGKNEVVLPKSHEFELEVSNFDDDSLDLPVKHQRGGAADLNRNYGGSMITGNQIKHSSSFGSESVGGYTEESFEEGQLTESEDHHFDVAAECRFPEKVDVKEEKTNICEIKKRENSKYLGLLSSTLVESSMPLPSLKGHPDENCKLPQPWRNDFKVTDKPSAHLPLNSTAHKEWKMERNSLSYLPVSKTALPTGYCNIYFNTVRGCWRRNCWYLHVPKQGDEKFCMEIIQKLVSTVNINLLQRAVQIFTNYYRRVPPGIHYDPEVQRTLLLSLLNRPLLQDVFLVLNIGAIVKILPSVEIFVKVFECVATTGLKKAVPNLVDIFCKLVEAGMILQPQHVDYIIKLLNDMQASESEISVILAMKTRLHSQESKKNWLYDLDLAIAEIEHCKERADWIKLGTLYINIRMGCENLTDLKRFSTCVADALTKDSKDERSVVPFCEFAETVGQDPNHNGVDKNLLGRIGISVIFSYHKYKQWMKGKKVLDKLHKMQIDFTTLKGLAGSESLAPRCQVVNVAVEIFLESGSLDGAIWVLKESEWIINTSLWPCDRMDVLNRHNLLCTIASEALKKSLYRQAFEVLQNLPGLQEPQDALDVSQYSALFNQLLDSCIENNSLGMSSSVVDFMILKNIPINFSFFRGLITALGRSCFWLRARSHYKSALSLGIYPPLEGNLYRKILHIPSYMSEIEMLLATEIFMVSNASNIQSPGGSSQTFQIVLKRCEEDKLRSKDDYRAATERLMLAVRISTPKLFIKHMTVNAAMEQVYILDHFAALKWLKENMKWAGKVWLFQ
ncbi:protein TOPAZ1 isoform X2 [Rhinatrema bivittatum]|uniref:protein TOPAZ1 isoform X2 n=1 Tax=Rhinatrema bivittatum TaxID=194408 RepID=UPI001125B7A5|nr:protein TOPAZ1 isoform X2 [Rhinatrema bivittatum]